MRIKSIDIFNCELKLKKVFITSLGPIKSSHHIFIRVVLEDGTYGWGECAPSNTINGENIKTCLSIAPDLCKSILDLNIFDHDTINEKLNQFIYGNRSIKSAIDVACYDAASKKVNKPLYQYLGGKINKKLYTDYTVSLDSIEKMTKQAIEIKKNGFSIIKIKVGENGIQDIERIKSIRNSIGDNIQLRIDANQGWGIEEAVKTLRGMNKYNIEYCEAPINKELAHKLNYVKENSPIKIMADESLFSSNDALKLVDGKHCQYFNLKIGKTGGIHEALKIIKIAERNNIMMQFGGFIESKIIFTVNCHLAYISENIKFLDCDSPLFHEENPIIGGLEYQKDWEMKIQNKPGLSVNVKKEYLQNHIEIKC